MQVGSNPAINAVLQVGQVTEAIEVQADAAMVETQSTGLGTVIDNSRVLELPLNGRNPTELILLSGMANVGGPADTALRTLAPYPGIPVSVAGGVGSGVLFLLDGTIHNETHTALNLPLPFPDALQEFKVETSALPAQYGDHAAATVNAVTKSGTNNVHGDLFEFVRTQRRLQCTKLFCGAARYVETESIRWHCRRTDPEEQIVFLRRLSGNRGALAAADVDRIRADAGNAGRRFHCRRVTGLQWRQAGQPRPIAGLREQSDFTLEV